MKKKSKKKRILVLLLLIPFVLIIGTVAGVALPLIVSYNNNAYENVDIVERSDEYVIPETDPQPEEWADVTLKEEDLGRDITTAETLANMRIRNIDSDFKRITRQRNVIETFAKKIITEKSLSEIYDLTNFAF